MICTVCHEHMQQDLDSQGRLDWFCLNPGCKLNNPPVLPQECTRLLDEEKEKRKKEWYKNNQ